MSVRSDPLPRLQATKPAEGELSHWSRTSLLSLMQLCGLPSTSSFWAVIEAAAELFAWSVPLGAIYFAGFFGYLSHRERDFRKRDCLS
jgi:hypothetical protein